MEVVIKYANVMDSEGMSRTFDSITDCQEAYTSDCNYIAEITFINGKPVGITIIHEYKR